MNEIKIFTDGGARGNPGPAAVGIVIFSDEKKIAQIKKCIGTATNNIAEYSAVLEALEYLAKEDSVNEAEFFLDSELVVKQLNGVYKVKDPKLKELFWQIKQKICELKLQASFTHVPREQNKQADALVNEALDEKAG